MRLVFDTNVVISALVFGGRLAWLRRAWAMSRARPLVCRETASELIRVLAYPKFRLSEPEITTLLADYLTFAETVEMPSRRPPVPVQCRDRDDVVFIQIALVADADGLVSGDKDLTVLTDALAPLPVLSPALLMRRLAP